MSAAIAKLDLHSFFATGSAAVAKLDLSSFFAEFPAINEITKEDLKCSFGPGSFRLFYIKSLCFRKTFLQPKPADILIIPISEVSGNAAVNIIT